jgi:serine/threonine protein kinase
MTHLQGDLAILGVENGEEVAAPRELSSPLISSARLLEKDVKHLDSQYIRSTCLIPSSSGSSTTGSACYELELFPFKESHYGQLYRGWILLRGGAKSGELLRTTNEFQVIVKKYLKASADSHQFADDPLQEFSLLQYLGDKASPHISGQLVCLTDGVWYYSVMRFCGYDIGSFVFNDRPLGEQRGRHLFRQLLEGMEFLQSHGVFHRDLSLENLVYDEQTHRLSIIDFGMSIVLPRRPSDGRPYLIRCSRALGKKHYMPPEVLANTSSFNGFLSDTWNLGVILFLLLTKKYVVAMASPLCAYYRLLQAGKLKAYLAHLNLGLSEEAVDLLDRLLQTDPHRRASLQEIRDHPWIASGPEKALGRGAEEAEAETALCPIAGTGEDKEQASHRDRFQGEVERKADEQPTS